MRTILAVWLGFLVTCHAGSFTLNRYVEDENLNGLPDDGHSWTINGVYYPGVDDELFQVVQPNYMGSNAPTTGTWRVDRRHQTVGGSLVSSITSGNWTGASTAFRMVKAKYDFSNNPAFSTYYADHFQAVSTPAGIVAVPSAMTPFHQVKRELVSMPKGSNPLGVRKRYEALVPILFEDANFQRLIYTVEIYTQQRVDAAISYIVELDPLGAKSMSVPAANPPGIAVNSAQFDSDNPEPGDLKYYVWRSVGGASPTVWASGTIHPFIPVKLFDSNPTSGGAGETPPPNTEPPPPGTPTNPSPTNPDGTPVVIQPGAGGGGSGTTINNNGGANSITVEGPTAEELQQAVRAGVNQAANDSTGANANMQFEAGEGNGEVDVEEMEGAFEALKTERDLLWNSAETMGTAWTQPTLPTSFGTRYAWTFALPIVGNCTIDLTPHQTLIFGFRQLVLACLCISFLWWNIKAIRAFLE